MYSINLNKLFFVKTKSLKKTGSPHDGWTSPTNNKRKDLDFLQLH